MNVAFKSRDFLTSSASRDSVATVDERVSIGRDEELVLDDRSKCRPAEFVENKLSGMLNGDSVLISQLRMKSLIARRA